MIMIAVSWSMPGPLVHWKEEACMELRDTNRPEAECNTLADAPPTHSIARPAVQQRTVHGHIACAKLSLQYR